MGTLRASYETMRRLEGVELLNNLDLTAGSLAEAVSELRELDYRRATLAEYAEYVRIARSDG